MTNRENLQRARLVVRKCQSGGSTTEIIIDDKLKQQYAAAKGLTWTLAEGFKNTDGNSVTITDEMLKNFATERAQKQEKQASWLNIANQTMDTVSSMFLKSNPNVTNQSNLTQGINSGYDMAADIVGQLNPLVGTIMKAGGFASDALTAAGIGTDQQTTVDKVLDSKLLKLTPFGLVNAIGASSTQSFSADEDAIAKVGGSYGGTVSDINEAVEKANKKYGLLSSGSKSRANKFIDEARRKQNIMAGIAQEATDQQGMVAAMGDLAAKTYLYQTQGGYDPRYALRTQQGGTLDTQTPFTPEIIGVELRNDRIVPGLFEQGGPLFKEVINPAAGKIEEWAPEVVSWIPELVSSDFFKTGGRIIKKLDAPEIEETLQQNIIPEGALHKNKHHMDNDENITKKGIPVVDNNANQQAEIECNEIIFTKEVTQKLEELYKLYYSEEATQKEKDEAAIDAGKLLTKEIMLNTDDRTGLIDTLKGGGKLQQDKPEYKDWLITVPADYISDLYDLETAFTVLPFEKMEQWRNEILKPQSEQNSDNSWHLPSTYQPDDNTIIFLKKGKTAKDNPELQGEFDFYTSNPEFVKEWKMQFDKDNNRWQYIKRAKLPDNE